jgi:Arc/MetJ-type ribon-helix-helix transcriptional regulator
MSDTEKITINMSAVDLGRVDLLVDEGFYSNRSDFIRTAIRKELDVHRDVVVQSVSRKTMVIGVVKYTRQDLEKAQAKGVAYDIRVVGTVVLDGDITPELARATIGRLKVYGILRASQAVKDALADRMKELP